MSQDTWAKDKQRQMPVSQLLAWCRQVGAGGLDGVTISGGEPFEQPQALAALLAGLCKWRQQSGLEFDLLCYSGYPYTTLQKRHPGLLARLDALIPEPFVHNAAMTHVWRGSSNQPLLALSQRGQERYSAYVDAPAPTDHKQIQIMLDGDRVWYVGIPARGDLEALEADCQAKGLTLVNPSWRSV